VPKAKTNVVLMGKQNPQIDNEKVKSIIASVDPNNIPVDFIYEVFIVTTDENRYSLKKETIKEGIDYNKIDEYLGKIKLDGEIKTVEIILDLAKVNARLEKESNLILDKIFKKD
jgi:hypothetical protein